MRHSRVVLGEFGLPAVMAELDKTLPVTGLAMLGEDPQRFMFKFRGPAAQHPDPGKGGRRARPAHDQSRTRRHRPAGTDDHAGPGRDHAVPEVSRCCGVVTGTDTIFIKSDRAGIKSVGVKGFQVPTDRNGQLWVHFARRDPSIYVSAVDVLEGQCPGRKDHGQAGADRNLGGRAQRHQDHAGVARHAGRRNPRPGAGSRADQSAAVATALRPRCSNSPQRCCSDFW